MICPYLKKTVIKKYFDKYVEEKEITEITQEFEDCVGISCPFAKIVNITDVSGEKRKHFNCLKTIADITRGKNENTKR